MAHGEREMIETVVTKRYMRRDERGRFKPSAAVGRSLAMDRPTDAKTVVPKSQRDRGDQRPS